MNLLGIDFGTKRIGLAIATSNIAQPLVIIDNFSSPRLTDIVSTKAMGKILKIVTEHKIEKIVVGISEGQMANKTESFIGELEKEISLPIEEVDETLSSVEAGRSMRHMPKNKREGRRDQIAAALILQDYLDLQV